MQPAELEQSLLQLADEVGAVRRALAELGRLAAELKAELPTPAPVPREIDEARARSSPRSTSFAL
jgi:hypothetical protein